MTELAASGCRIIAVCKPQSNIHRFLQEHGIECRSLPHNRKISYSSIRFVRKLLQEEHVDAVHVHLHRDIWIPSLAMRNDSRRKLFLSVYMGVISKNDILHRWIYERVDAIFTSSEQLNARLHVLYPVPQHKIHFIPYGRRIDKYELIRSTRAEIRSRLQVRDDELLVGTMVRIDPGKGALDFTRSILYLDQDLARNVKYVIVGEPTRKAVLRADESPFERHCEEYLEEINVFIHKHQLAERVRLAGFQDDLVGYLSAFDIFVFPSRDELYSLVVLDAMGMNLPVVAARAGGNVFQIMHGKNGLLYEVGNSEDLAVKLIQYVRNPALRKEHGAAGRRFVEQRHSMDETVQQLLSFYGDSLHS